MKITITAHRNKKNYGNSPKNPEICRCCQQNYQASENIFREGESAQYYFQIVSGNVKMNNYDESGKEYIQNLLEAGECLGESFLFTDHQYPMNAVAINSCEVLSLKKSLFIRLIQQNPKICFEINKNLSKKLHYK